MEHDIRFAVLDAYQNSAPDTYHVKHHLDGYNQFVFEKIPQVIAENNPILILTKDIENKYYKYTYRIYVGGKDADLTKTVTFTKPAFFRKPSGGAGDSQEMRALFPNEARNRHMNYVTIVEAPIDVEITTREEDPAVPEKVELVRLTNKFQFRLPVMVRSRLCSLYGLPNVATQKLGEGKQDQGGQFIMGGAEKVVVTQERIAFNEPFTRLYKPDEEQVASISISSRALSGVKVRVFSLWLHNLDGTKLPKKRAHFRGLINASISGVNGPVPLFLLFRALGVVNDEDIVRYIYPDGNVPADVEEIITLNAKAAGGQVTTAAVLEHLRTFVVNRSHTSLQNALRNSFLINQPDDPKSKAIYLGQLARKLIDTQTSRIPEVDRDNYRQKRVASTGTLMTELFAELQGEFEKEVLRNVTSKQNYNKAVYQDDRNKDMFYEGDPNGELLSGDVITMGISRALRGNWPNIDGAAQALTRLTQFDTISHLRRLVAPLGEGLKLIAPRMVPLSGQGYVCPVESPSGGPRIGLVKNMAVMAQITKESDPNRVLELIEGREDFLPISAIHPTGLSGGNRGFVVVNGTMVGTVENILAFAEEMRAKRRRGELSVYLGVSVDYQGKTLFLRTDADRLTRPLFNARVVRELGDQFREVLVRVRDGRISWADLLTGGIQADGNRGRDQIGEEGVLEMIDTHEANNIFLVSHPGELLTNPSATHCEIHASTIFGVVGSLIPQAPHNQGPRNLQSIAQSKQATSLQSTAFRYRHDSGYILISPQKPLVTTWHYRKQGAGNMGYGDNLIVALACFTGYNQEDGVLMNRDSIERGLFHVLYSKVWDAEEMESDKTLETLKIEDPRKQGTVVSLKQGKNQDLLDPETGVVRVGEEVHGKDVLIGMTSKIPGQYPADVSVSIGKWDGGQVMDTRTMVSPAGKKKVSVKLGQVRIPEFGDKMSSRAGQKGTIGLLVPAEDMPRTADGIVPDLIVNPHAIPKRMTVGQFIEVVAAKAAALGGFETDATAFTNSQPMDTLGEQLESKGFERECDEIMQNGITGEQIPTEIFIGPTQYMRLKHMVKDKQNARATGPMVRLTHQPVHGRADEGGLRIGEMERDSLIGHGMANFLNESMMERSDGYAIDVCRKSGMPAAVNEEKGIQISPDIDGPIQYRGNTLDGLRLDANKEQSQSFAKVNLPYTMKLAMEELNAGQSASMRMITESQISRPVPSVQTIRRRRVIKAPKLPAREIGVGREEELGRTSPRNTPEVKEMTGGGGMRRNSVEDRLKKMGILSPGVLGDAVEGEQNVPEVGSKDEQIGGLAASILRRKKQENLIEGLERAPQIGGGEASGGTGNRVVGGGEGGVKSMGDSGFGSIGGGGGGGGIVVSKSGADDPITPAPAPSGGGEAGGGSGETKTITLN